MIIDDRKIHIVQYFSSFFLRSQEDMDIAALWSENSRCPECCLQRFSPFALAVRVALLGGGGGVDGQERKSVSLSRPEQLQAPYLLAALFQCVSGKSKRLNQTCFDAK